MMGGLFSKGSSGHSVSMLRSSTSHCGKTVGSTNGGYVREIGHGMPSSSGDMKISSKVTKIDKSGSSNGD